MRTTASQFLGKIYFLLLILLLAACNHSPKDDGSAPGPLFPQPQSIEANPPGGYEINPLTSESIQPLINSMGEVLVTGVPIPVTPKFIHPDSVSKPSVVQAPSLESLERHNAHANRFMVPDDISSILVDHSQLVTVKLGEGNPDFVLINTAGDTILTGVPLPARGKVVRSIQPKSVQALPMATKDAAITNLQYLDVDQGMNSSFLLTLLEDRQGNLWMGGEGVSRYDGETFTHYTEKEGLSNFSVRAILEDRSGNLWFGTIGGGVSRYDGATFTHYTEKEGLSNNRVWAIVEDRSGNLWFGTDGGGVSRLALSGAEGYDGASFTHYTEKEGLSNNRVISILEDRSGNLWFGTNGGGVSRYDGTTFTHYTEKEGLSNNIVRSILEDKSGNLWFGTAGGVSRYDGETFTHYTEKEGLSNNMLRSILEDRSGNLWFGTQGGGVSRLALSGAEGNDGATFTHYTENEGLSNNGVMAILEDRNGNLWFGTNGGGLVSYDVASFTHFTESRLGLKNNGVWTIIEDSRGYLWFGTIGGGVSRYDGHSFTHFTQKDSLNSYYVRAILEDRQGNLWFGTEGGGVSRYDGVTFTHYTEKEGLSNNSVWAILEDRSGNLWFGTDGGGVSRYDGETFTHYTEKEGLSNNSVMAILEDRSGNLWFGTIGGGVSRYDGATFTNYTENEGLSNNAVGSIFEDRSGNLWFGTAGGVSRYDGETLPAGQASFTHYTEKEGLSNNNVRSILEDRSGNLWIGTARGPTKIVFDFSESVQLSNEPEKSLRTIHTFGKQDGIASFNYGPGALIDSENRIWWASFDGAMMLDLNTFSTATPPPVVYMRQVDINEAFIDYRNISDGNEITFNGVKNFENYPLNLKLPFDKNHLTFHFAAIDWKAPHKIHYSHRMLGLNDNWSNPTREAKADYRNLPYGTYTFQIRAIGESGVWSEPFEYTFTINPPWWQTWWAYCLYAAIMLLVFWRIHKFQKARTIRQEREKAKDRELEQAEEIKKAYTELKSTQSQLIQSEKMASLGELTAGIAHEIQNPLNFVNNFSEVNMELIAELKEEVKAGNLEDIKAIADDIAINEEKILQHGKRADAIVKGMLQHSRSSSGVKEPTDINALADEYLRLSYHGLRAKDKSFNADFKTEFDGSLPEINIIPQDIGRVLLNLINNAFYAVAEKQRNLTALDNYVPTVIISTKNLSENIEISVKDNGNGIPEEIKKKIFQPFFTTKPTGEGTGLGLSLAYDIVKAHGGELKVDTKKDEGTAFIVQLPI